MQFTQHQLDSSNGETLNCYAWSAQRPQASILFLHGWGDHGLRYADVAQQLCHSGFNVLVLEFAGHGLSSGARAQVADFSLLIQDALVARNTLDNTLPVFLHGHSMGGCVAAHLAITFPDKFSGVIFNSAALAVSPHINIIKKIMARVLGRAWPALPVGYLKSAEMMSSMHSEQENYRTDKTLYHGRINAGTGLALLQANAWVANNAKHLRIPMLILQGEKDVLVDPAGARHMFDHAVSEDKRIKLYPRARHDLLHEFVRDSVMAEIVGWVSARVKQS